MNCFFQCKHQGYLQTQRAAGLAGKSNRLGLKLILFSLINILLHLTLLHLDAPVQHYEAIKIVFKFIVFNVAHEILIFRAPSAVSAARDEAQGRDVGAERDEHPFVQGAAGPVDFVVERGRAELHGVNVEDELGDVAVGIGQIELIVQGPLLLILLVRGDFIVKDQLSGGVHYLILISNLLKVLLEALVLFPYGVLLLWLLLLFQKLRELLGQEIVQSQHYFVHRR